MALIDLDGRWLRLNRSLCQMLGRTEQRAAHDRAQRAQPPRGPPPGPPADQGAAGRAPALVRDREALPARRRDDGPRARARLAHARRRRAAAVLPVPARRPHRAPPRRGRAPRQRGAPAGDHRQLAGAHHRQGPRAPLPARQPPLGGALRRARRPGRRAHVGGGAARLRAGPTTSTIDDRVAAERRALRGDDGHPRARRARTSGPSCMVKFPLRDVDGDVSAVVTIAHRHHRAPPQRRGARRARAPPRPGPAPGERRPARRRRGPRLQQPAVGDPHLRRLRHAASCPPTTRCATTSRRSAARPTAPRRSRASCSCSAAARWSSPRCSTSAALAARPRAPAQPHAQRAHRPAHHGRARPASGARRPRAARAGARQPRGQRPRRDARRRHAHDRGRPRAPDGVRITVVDDGAGHARGGARPRLRAVLHDEGPRRGHGARPGDGARHRHRLGRHGRDRVGARARAPA